MTRLLVLIGRRSKHQAPWSIEVRRGRGGATVASSERSYADLHLAPLPGDLTFGDSAAENHVEGVAGGWELADWGLWANYEFAHHEPTTLRGAKPSEQVIRGRVIPDERLALDELQHDHQRFRGRAGKRVESEPLAGQLGWIERWETISAEEVVPRMGVSIYCPEGQWIASMSYSTWIGPDAEGRCRAWKERLLACMGASLQPELHAAWLDR